MINSEVMTELEHIVGERYVSDEPEIQFLYHYDFITTEPEGECDIAIMPETVEEVQEIMRVANKYKIPVVPWVSGINFGSIATPKKGGIVMDLRRMNRVLEVNEDDMYAVIEGGVTWADIKGYIDKHHPDFQVGITWSPPGTGVIPSCLCYGMFNLGMLGGTGAEFINGLEVVLPTGEMVRAGSSSLSNYWYGRQPLPDIAGLFIGWEGTTGVVTKAAIKIWPKLPYRTDYVTITVNLEEGVKAILKLSKAGLGIIDLCVINLGWCQSLQCFNEKSVAVDPVALGLPDCVAIVTTQAYTEKQHEAQCEAIKDICKEFNIDLLDVKNTIKTFPTEMTGLMTHLTTSTSTGPPIHFWTCWDFARGGGGQWIGSYCSTRDIYNYYKLAREICIKYGKPPQFYSRIMGGGHYCVARINVNFNKNDPDDIQNARNLLREIHDAVQQLDGVVMYKTPLWASKVYEEKTTPGTKMLVKKIKKMLDPNNIMNPGQGIEGE